MCVAPLYTATSKECRLCREAYWVIIIAIITGTTSAHAPLIGQQANRQYIVKSATHDQHYRVRQ